MGGEEKKVSDMSSEEIVKLTDRQPIKGAFLGAKLTKEERDLLSPFPDHSDFFTTGHLGYLDPSKVVRYFTEEIGSFEGVPELKVYLDFERDGGHGLAGRYVFFRKEDEEIHYILSGPILQEDVEERRIDVDYIEEDNTGLFIPITEERIQGEIEQEIGKIDEGMNGNFRKAERLAEVGDFNFSEEIEKGRKYGRQKYLETYSTVENLESVLNDLEEWENHGFDVHSDELSRGMDPRIVVFSDFYKVVLDIPFPNSDLKKRAVALLRSHSQAYGVTAVNLVEEKIKELGEEEDGLRRYSDKTKLLANQLEDKD